MTFAPTTEYCRERLVSTKNTVLMLMQRELVAEEEALGTLMLRVS